MKLHSYYRQLVAVIKDAQALVTQQFANTLGAKRGSDYYFDTVEQLNKYRRYTNRTDLDDDVIILQSLKMSNYILSRGISPSELEKLITNYAKGDKQL